MSGVSDVQLEVPADQSPISVGHRALKSPGSKPAFKLTRFSPKLLPKTVLFNDPVANVISNSMENAFFSLEQRLLHTYPPRFRLPHAFPRRDLDDFSNIPWSVLNDSTAIIKPASMERTPMANIQRSISGCTPSTPIQSLSCSSSIVTVTIDDFPNNYLNALEDSAGTTTIVKAWLSDEENMPLYPPTPSPSFEVIQIFPGDDMDVSDDTILPLSLLNAPSTRGGLLPIIIALKNSLSREAIDILQIALAWTAALALGFGFLYFLVHWMGNAFACVFMVASSFYLGVLLVVRKCATKRPPTFKIRDPDNLAVQYNDVQSARYESSEHGQSSVVQVNSRFEISSLPSSQDIFRSELLMNGQVVSSTPRRSTRRKVRYPETTSIYTPTPSHMSLVVFEMTGTSPETGLRTRRRPFASTLPSNLSIV